MRVGILGLGRAGAVHLEACGTVPGVEVAAVYDPALAARRAAAAAGVKTYAHLPRMLEMECLDAAVICAPPADHVPLAMACLERGLHVLCEKPLALTARDAVELFDSARRAERLLQVASKFRHVREVRYVKELLASGGLGEPISFEISFCSPVDMSGRWNAQPAQAGGGVIIDNGCHAFDIIYFLFGSVTRVHAIQLKPVQHLPVEDSACLHVWAGDGILGNVNLSWSWTTGRDTYLIVRGTRGTVEVGWQGCRLAVDGTEWREVGGPYDKRDAHRRMHGCFADAVALTGAPWITATECLRVMAAVDAAYGSIHSGTWERLAMRSDVARRYDWVQPSEGVDATV